MQQELVEGTVETVESLEAVVHYVTCHYCREVNLEKRNFEIYRVYLL